MTCSEGDAGHNDLQKFMMCGKSSLWLKKRKMSQLSSERKRKAIQEFTVSSAFICQKEVYGTSCPRNCPDAWRIKKQLGYQYALTFWILLEIRGNQWVFLTLFLTRHFIASLKPKQWDVGRKLAGFLVAAGYDLCYNIQQVAGVAVTLRGREGDWSCFSVSRSWPG